MAAVERGSRTLIICIALEFGMEKKGSGLKVGRLDPSLHGLPFLGL